MRLGNSGALTMKKLVVITAILSAAYAILGSSAMSSTSSTVTAAHNARAAAIDAATDSTK